MTEELEERRQGTREIKKELDEVRGIVYDLKATKQDRVKAVVWVPLVVWIFTQSLGGVWFAASMSSKIDNLATIVESGTTDRYYRTQAQADFALRDQRINFLQEQIKVNNDKQDARYKEFRNHLIPTEKHK